MIIGSECFVCSGFSHISDKFGSALFYADVLYILQPCSLQLKIICKYLYAIYLFIRQALYKPGTLCIVKLNAYGQSYTKSQINLITGM